MKPIKEILDEACLLSDNVNNVINNNFINVNNDNRYCLNKSKFTPRTEEAQLAEEIATTFQDLQNYAFYMAVIKRKGVQRIKTLFASTLSDIKEKEKTKTPVRSPAKYFVWKYKHNYY